MSSIESFNLMDEPVCPVCHVGRMSPRLSVYVRQFGETLVNVPNTPAWECDVCHAREFEPAAVQRIEMLVGQAGPPPNRFRPMETSKELPKPAAKVAPKTNKKNVKSKTAAIPEEVSSAKPRSKAKS